MARGTRKRNHSKHVRKTSKNQSQDEAGRAIAAGGFGCVFKPAINCGNRVIAKKMQKNGFEYITKVMIARYAREEMLEVKKILPIVKKIPHEKRYFLLDGIFECKNFGPLSAEDKIDFNSKCNNLGKIGINESNVNKKIRSLSAIYIPYGGESVSKIMKKLASDYNKDENRPPLLRKIGLVTLAMADVLENAVVPMNNLGLIHLDLKGDNMLLNADVLEDEKMPYIKIIDWGLAGTISGNNIPDAARDRPLQFNGPFSNILFNYSLVKSIVTDDCYGGEISEAQINSIATRIVVLMVDDWAGHAKYISNDLNNFLLPYSRAKGNQSTLNSNADCTTEALTIIAEYIAPILRKYLTRNSNGLLGCSFNEKAYFQEVYRYNCDVWGLLTTFQDFIGRMTASYSRFRNLPLSRAMSNILFKYCFSPTYAAERIPINSVISDMKNIAIMCKINKDPSYYIPSTPVVAKINRPPGLKTISPADERQSISLNGKKRCPKGYKKHPTKPGKCRKTVKKGSKKKASPKKKTTSKKKSTRYELMPLSLGRKRCPKGYKKLAGDGIIHRIVCAKK